MDDQVWIKILTQVLIEFKNIFTYFIIKKNMELIKALVMGL